MNSISLLKDGIRNADWTKICEVYHILTGETIGVPKLKQKNVDNIIDTKTVSKKLTEIKDTISCLIKDIYDTRRGGSGNKTENKQKDTREKEIDENPKDDQVITPTKRNGKFGHTVLVTDIKPSDGFKSLEEEKSFNIEVHKELRKQNPKKRRQRRKYNVQCNQCSKTFKSHHSGRGEIGQKCDDCLRGIRAK